LICINAQNLQLREPFQQNSPGIKSIMRRIAMTQHLSPEDTAADRRAMRQLATVIGCFIVATAIMALAVGLIMG
jgi:hypothetical protein